MTADRPTFDEVSRGYHRDQVDAYIASLWRYASQATARAAEAEAKLGKAQADAYNSRPQPALPSDPKELAALVGERVGRLLQLATDEAEATRTAARSIAESALTDAVERSAASGPVVREAREQADRLLMDARAEADRAMRQREREADARVAVATAALDDLRRRQTEVVDAFAVMQALLSRADVEDAVARLTGAAGNVAPPRPTADTRADYGFEVIDDDIEDAEIVEEDYRPGRSEPVQ